MTTTTDSRYAYGTTLEIHPYSGAAVRARAMCSDGRVRAVRFGSGQPDTWFSIPGSVVVGGRRVTGYVTVCTAQGHDTATDDESAVVKFRAVRYGRNCDALPEGEWIPAPDNGYRIVPPTMLAGRGSSSRVVQVVAHPPGRHPAGAPIRADLTAVEVRTASGGVRWFGAERAWIGPDLRMHIGPVDPRDSVRMAWERSDGPTA